MSIGWGMHGTKWKGRGPAEEEPAEDERRGIARRYLRCNMCIIDQPFFLRRTSWTLYVPFYLTCVQL